MDKNNKKTKVMTLRLSPEEYYQLTQLTSRAYSKGNITRLAVSAYIRYIIKKLVESANKQEKDEK